MNSTRQSLHTVRTRRGSLVLVVMLACSAAQAEVPTMPVHPDEDYRPPGSSVGVQSAYQEALEFLHKGDCESAEKKLAMVLRQASRDANMQFLQGMALRCQNDHKGAAQQFKKAIRTDRDKYVAYKYLGLSFVELKQPEKAKNILARIERLRDRCGDDCPDELKDAHEALSAALEEQATE